MFQNLLKKIAQRLNKAKIPYMVIGGQAVLLYGEPRLTKDIDITLGIGIDGFEKVAKIVTGLILKILVDNPKEFVKKTFVLPTKDENTGIRIDFIFSFSPYERQAIEKAINVKFGKTNVRFAALEDVVIHKVIAGRARDIEDIKSILLKNPNYNIEYIKNWLKKFDKSLTENFSITFRKILKDLRS